MGGNCYRLGNISKIDLKNSRGKGLRLYTALDTKLFRSFFVHKIKQLNKETIILFQICLENILRYFQDFMFLCLTSNKSRKEGDSCRTVQLATLVFSLTLYCLNYFIIVFREIA